MPLLLPPSPGPALKGIPFYDKQNRDMSDKRKAEAARTAREAAEAIAKVRMEAEAKRRRDEEERLENLRNFGTDEREWAERIKRRATKLHVAKSKSFTLTPMNSSWDAGKSGSLSSSVSRRQHRLAFPFSPTSSSSSSPFSSSSFLPHPFFLLNDTRSPRPGRRARSRRRIVSHQQRLPVSVSRQSR